MQTDFLPMNLKEMKERGWDAADFVYVCGDAYVDHPSFGAAIITRILEHAGYRVAVIAQPDWKDQTSITVCGEPRLAFLVSSGNMDSMVNHYTSFKKRRHQDAYTPGGGFSKRPNHAVVVYSNLIRKVYKKTPILLGGIEASLRRLAHYDYWSDSVKRSILLDAGADILMYGMGERSVLEIARALDAGIPAREITSVRGTVVRLRELPEEEDKECLILPPYPEVKDDKEAFARSFYIQYQNTDAITAFRLVEPYREKEYVLQNPPALPLSEEEMDQVYSLPYTRRWHPSYDAEGGIPALAEVKFSLASCRGCYGGCSFCALTFHQGRRIQSRSRASLVEEARQMTKDPDFKGYIHDVGGPTANFRKPACKKQLSHGVCSHRQCLFPEPCPNLIADHSDYIRLLRELRDLPGVKKVFIRSGIRFDYVMADRNRDFLEELCRYHVSGQLKVAPEHICDSVLSLMGKPSRQVYDSFCQAYAGMNRKIRKKQYLVPYLMSSHPGSGLKEAVALAEFIRDLGYMPEQVQDFYPTPGTISTCMYHTGLDPRTMKAVYVPVSLKEKQMQRALIQYRNPDNYKLVREALIRAGREDLIGFGKKCLVPPESGAGRTDKGVGRPDKGAGRNGKRAGRTDTDKRTGKAGRGAGKPDKGTGRTDRKRPGERSFSPGNEKNTTIEKTKKKRKTIRNVHKKKSAERRGR